MPEPQLSPRMQEVAWLVADEGKSYPAAAKALGISVSTVKRYAEEIGKRLRKAPRQAMFEWVREQREDGREVA